MPIDAFWLMNKNIDRLQADETYNDAVKTARSQGGEQFMKYLEELDQRRGNAIEFDSVDKSVVTASGQTVKLSVPVYQRGDVLRLKGLGKLR